MKISLLMVIFLFFHLIVTNQEKNLIKDIWKLKLTKQQYNVLFNKETETPYTGKFLDHFKNGLYRCAACNNPLYESKTKFKANCGWAAFFDSIPGSVIRKEDLS